MRRRAAKRGVHVGISESSASSELPVAMRVAIVSRAAWTTLPKERAAKEPSGRENEAWLEASSLSGSP